MGRRKRYTERPVGCVREAEGAAYGGRIEVRSLDC